MAEGGADRSMSETERLPIYSSMYSTHSLNYVGKASLEVCNIMTLLGYGDEIRRRRIEKYREMDRLQNAEPYDVTLITAGSKAEGLTGWLESDRDVLCVMKSAICVESGIDLQTIPEHLDVYKMDTLTVYPGHCRLLHDRPAPRSYYVLVNAMCDDGIGNTLLSSTLYVDELSKFIWGRGRV
ncbi:hypothetical protein DPMN_040666 [Dreissena polymorpha]|uniref:Uncharacterized protein n=1 Tax=Dreissena polymorpha TaxID=45954 RepID=A0A9D4HV98_DREPO|nr:hypothetical protein DPMN_040666 [Dreissena polymorpha]